MKGPATATADAAAGAGTVCTRAIVRKLGATLRKEMTFINSTCGLAQYAGQAASAALGRVAGSRNVQGEKFG